MAERNRAIVVGGGLAGLTAAAFLARGGRRVTVLERSSAPGGRAASHELGGATFNQGPHALYRGSSAVSTLAELGVAYAGAVPRLEAPRAYVNGTLVPLPVGAGSLLTSSLLGWRGRLDAAQILTKLGDPNIANEGETVDAWLARKTDDLGLRAFLAALVRLSTYTNAPHLQSARAALAQVAMAQKTGVLYLDGGWQTLVQGLVATCDDAGVRVVCNAPVDSLTRRGDEWEVRFRDESLAAADVVLATGPSLASELTGAAFDVTPVHAACLDLCLRAYPRAAPRFVLGIDRPTYFSVHSDAARLASGGQVVLHIAKYIDPRAPIDARADEADLEAVALAAHPGWRDDVLARRFLPRMAVVNAAVTPAGRPDVDAAGLPGVHLAGDWVGPYGMLADAAFASARRAAHAALRRDAPRTIVTSHAHAETLR